MNIEASSRGTSGTSTLGLAFGGFAENGPSTADYTGATEKWNGTNWTSDATMNFARYNVYFGGVQSSALAAGGANADGDTEQTEEYVAPGFITKTLTS